MQTHFKLFINYKMTDPNDIAATTSTNPTIDTGVIDTQIDINFMIEGDSDDDDDDDDDDYLYYSELLPDVAARNRTMDREKSLLMKWLTRKSWMESIEMIRKMDNTTLESNELLSRHTLHIFHFMIQLLHRYPETLVHYMEQSNENNRNWDGILRLIEQLSSSEHFHPDRDIARQDHQSLAALLSKTILIKERGWTLLHWLCSHGGTPIPVIQALVRYFSMLSEITEMILQADTYIGDTCLHLLCRNACQFSATKLQVLLSSLSDHDAQNAILLRNQLGGTILHAATIGAAVFDVIRTIVSIQPKVLLICSKDGVHPVTALYYSYSDTIPGYMAISKVLSEHDPGDNNFVRCPSFDDVNDTYNYNRDDVLNRTNSTLLRFWEKVEYLVVQRFLLSDACPTELLRHSREEQENDEDAEKDRNKRRHKFILHGLLLCNVPVKMINLCLCVHPISATAIDRHGNTPLHILLQNRPYHHGMYKNNEYESIHWCVRTYPYAAGLVNHQQFVPLQLAIINKIPTSSGVYDVLLNAAPNTIHYRCTTPPGTDKATDTFEGIGLYPYQLAAIQNSTSLQSINTIYYLLLKEPSLLDTQYVPTNG